MSGKTHTAVITALQEAIRKYGMVQIRQARPGEFRTMPLVAVLKGQPNEFVCSPAAWRIVKPWMAARSIERVA